MPLLSNKNILSQFVDPYFSGFGGSVQPTIPMVKSKAINLFIGSYYSKHTHRILAEKKIVSVVVSVTDTTLAFLREVDIRGVMFLKTVEWLLKL